MGGKGLKAWGRIPYNEGSTKGPFSFACGYIDQIVSVQEFIANLVNEAESILERFADQHHLGLKA